MDCQKVINIALNEVGYLEKRTNTNLDSKTANAGYGNYTKYARDLDNIKDFYNGKKNGYAWCDVFVDWCFVKAYGVETAKKLLCQPSKSTGAGVGFSMNFYKSKGQFYTSPKVGDQIFFTQNGELTHTGLVYKVDSSTVYTIEGNTSSAAGVVANGGAVAKKSYRRSSAYIYGYGRPDYDGTGTTGSSTTDKDTSDKKEETAKKHIVDVDGQWGPDTTRKAQEVFGTTVDGIVTDQYKIYKSQNPGLFAFEWLNNPSSYGSELIRAIQKKVGANVDGRIGPETIKKMQKWLGTVQDGYVSNPSDMVKAFQKWLNTNKPSNNTPTDKIDVDGKWGPATTRKAQKVFGTTVDGIVTDQYKIYKSQNPGLFAFEWLDNPSDYGSELIRAIQKKVGANVDGHIGPETIKKMQKWLGTIQDGYVSNPSDMVKAFQKWLNKQ